MIELTLLLSLLTYTYSLRLSQASGFTISNYLSIYLLAYITNEPTMSLYRLFGSVATVTDIVTVTDIHVQLILHKMLANIYLVNLNSSSLHIARNFMYRYVIRCQIQFDFAISRKQINSNNYPSFTFVILGLDLVCGL
uniref:Uncharacterized protein n=1 Tax=Arundo donax TaxID=35708 RepID=A0A0A9DLM4_ARUDO